MNSKNKSPERNISPNFFIPKNHNSKNSKKNRISSSPKKSPEKPKKSPIFKITKVKDHFPEDYKIRRFILLDTETTGLEISYDRLIAINAVEMINGELTGLQFNAYLDKRFVQNYRPLMYYLSDYNYSRNDNIKKSLKTFLDFVGDDMIVTHNADFDMKFINRELIKWGLNEIPLDRCICTLKYFRNLKKIGIIDKNFGLKLCDLCQYYSIYVDLKDLHQGIVDTIVFGRVVAKMFEDGLFNFDDNNGGFNDFNDLGRSFIDYNNYDLNENQSLDEIKKENEISEFINDNIYNNNNFNLKFKKRNCISDDKKDKKKLNINNFKINQYKRNKNNYIQKKNKFPLKENNNIDNINNNINFNNNKDIKYVKKQNNMNKYEFPKYKKNGHNYKNYEKNKIKEEQFFKSKSHNINFEKDETKTNFIKNAFKSYISTNQYK